MQSYLQSRRILQAVRAQVDRDLEKQAVSGPGLLNTAEGQGEGTDSTEPKDEAGEPSSPNSEGNDEEEKEEEDDGAPSTAAAHRVWTAATAQTHHTARTALGHSITGVLARDRRTHEGKDGKVFVVGWSSPADALNPRNWPLGRRVGCTLQISLVALAVGAASGIDATVIPQAAADLRVSEVAESLCTGIYLVGMGFGALVAGPFSETFGRNYVYTGSMAVFLVWIMASALAPNFPAQIVFRFLAGCSASTPLVCAGGSVSDMYDALEKTWAFPVYAIFAFGGPMLGAVVGAYIGPSPLISWRWTEWVILIVCGLVTVLLLLLMPETYAPLLLHWKAKHFREITGDDRYRSESEIVHATLFSRLKISMTRPFQMATEPIIIAMTLYLTTVYIVLFTFLIGFPYIFQFTYGISQGLSNVIFISMFIGLQFVFLLVPVVWRIVKGQIKDAEAEGKGSSFKPESRLWYAILGPSFAIPISLFWMGWTDFAQISIWSPILAVGLFGFGVMGVFIQAYMYIIDAYEVYSASALTLATLVRYVVAGGMTVVGIPFYENLGTHYALTILGSIATLLVPIPFVLYRWGHLLRKRSRYAVSREA